MEVNMNELILNNVLKDFKGKKAVDNINLILKNGVYGLLGENGAGKTTLMRLISRLLKISKGDIVYNGTNIENMGRIYRKKLGYLPQEFGYYQDFTAKTFLLYLAILKDLPNNYANNKVMETLEMVGLSGVKDKKLKSFSGGMLRRVGIAQTLLNDPPILILDEPTSGLDPMERVRFRNIISSLSKERIILLSTHIVTDVEYIADEIIMMNQGKIVAQGSVEDIIKPIRNKVWECDVTGDMADMKSKFLISNLRNVENSTNLRIISLQKPTQKAFCVEPTLEDAYLYYLSYK